MNVAISASVSSGSSPLKVTFTPDITYAGGDKRVSRVEWAFGDGFESNDYSATHIFQMVGSYTVTMKCYVETRWKRFTDCLYQTDITEYTATTTISVKDAIKLYTLKKCYRVGMGNPVQGYGPSEYQGTHWPFPPVWIGGRACIDDQNVERQVVFDQRSGTFREIGLRVGPAGSNMGANAYADVDASGNTFPIPWSVEFGEDTAEDDKDEIEHLRTSVGQRWLDDRDTETTGPTISAFVDGGDVES